MGHQWTNLQMTWLICPRVCFRLAWQALVFVLTNHYSDVLFFRTSLDRALDRRFALQFWESYIDCKSRLKLEQLCLNSDSSMINQTLQESFLFERSLPSEENRGNVFSRKSEKIDLSVTRLWQHLVWKICTHTYIYMLCMF